MVAETLADFSKQFNTRAYLPGWITSINKTTLSNRSPNTVCNSCCPAVAAVAGVAVPGATPGRRMNRGLTGAVGVGVAAAGVVIAPPGWPGLNQLGAVVLGSTVMAFTLKADCDL